MAQSSIMGFSDESSKAQLQLESNYDKLLNANNLDEWMQYMTARPHHVGSPYDKKVVDFIATKFKEWGYEVAKNEFNAKVNDLGFYEIPTNQKIDAINKKVVIKTIESLSNDWVEYDCDIRKSSSLDTQISVMNTRHIEYSEKENDKITKSCYRPTRC